MLCTPLPATIDLFQLTQRRGWLCNHFAGCSRYFSLGDQFRFFRIYNVVLIFCRWICLGRVVDWSDGAHGFEAKPTNGAQVITPNLGFLMKGLRGVERLEIQIFTIYAFWCIFSCSTRLVYRMVHGKMRFCDRLADLAVISCLRSSQCFLCIWQGRFAVRRFGMQILVGDFMYGQNGTN